MKVPSFNEFITEQKEDKIRILVISAEPSQDKMFHTARRVTEEAKKLGHDVYVVKVEGAIVSYENEWRQRLLQNMLFQY